MIIVSATYFKGLWTHPFRTKNTCTAPFYLNEEEFINVEFMRINKEFNTCQYPEIDASIVELPYHGSDVSMLIILPNSRTGLSALEEKLKKTDLMENLKQLQPWDVNVELPKFRIEFNVSLQHPLQNVKLHNGYQLQA